MGDEVSAASSRIFISYRREDSAGHVLALLPALRKHYGADRVFKDTDTIPPGVDFLKFIKRELATCSVMLAIIGRDWLTIQDSRLKQRRLDNPDDFLRTEVATALKNERIRVVPVLVERSTMPAPEDLPPRFGGSGVSQRCRAQRRALGFRRAAPYRGDRPSHDRLHPHDGLRDTAT